MSASTSLATSALRLQPCPISAWALEVGSSSATFKLACSSKADRAGKAARAGAITEDSKREQASVGLDSRSEEEFARFHRLNDAYMAKFGFPFIVCVRRHSRDSILAQFERRLPNDAEAEFAAA